MITGQASSLAYAFALFAPPMSGAAMARFSRFSDLKYGMNTLLA